MGYTLSFPYLQLHLLSSSSPGNGTILSLRRTGMSSGMEGRAELLKLAETLLMDYIIMAPVEDQGQR